MEIAGTLSHSIQQELDSIILDNIDDLQLDRHVTIIKYNHYFNYYIIFLLIVFIKQCFFSPNGSIPQLEWPSISESTWSIAREVLIIIINYY